jgi:hypothetical protein
MYVLSFLLATVDKGRRGGPVGGGEGPGKEMTGACVKRVQWQQRGGKEGHIWTSPEDG